MYIDPIEDLIKKFKTLPSVGRRTAERFVFHLLKSGKKDVAELMHALKTLMESVQSCEVCWNFADKNICNLCANPKRDQHTICVVSEPQHQIAIEKTGNYHGLYHILRGTIQADDTFHIENLKVRELLIRVADPKTQEVILACNPDMGGETTMLFLEQQIKKRAPLVKITRLARGLSLGADVQYADEITLSNALAFRTEKK